MKKKYFIFLVFLFSFFSCEKIFIGPDPSNDPISNFDYLWKIMDEKYSFFTFRKINWDSLYTIYRPEINNDMTKESLFKVMDKMMFQLRDGHIRLTSSFDISSVWKGEQSYPGNFNYDLLKANYLKSDFRVTGSLINKEIDSIGYIYCGGFSSMISSSAVDYVIGKFRNLKGIIIDVRGNGGGDGITADILASRFNDTRRLVLYELFKNGPGHNDFSPPIARYLEAGKDPYKGKVAVLTNRASFSATNDFVLKMASMPNVLIIGDTTGGGGGIPINYELPNGWIIGFPTTQTLTSDFKNIESGIPPDIPVNLRKGDEYLGKDTILEKALEELKK